MTQVNSMIIYTPSDNSELYDYCPLCQVIVLFIIKCNNDFLSVCKSCSVLFEPS